VSQEYEDRSSNSELMEWRVGTPMAAASFFIGLKTIENILSRAPWTFDRGVRLSIAFVFVVLILWSWRLIRKDLKTFNGLVRLNGELEIDARSYQRLRSLLTGLVSLYALVTMMIVMAFMAMRNL
jgi:hypothetical protein